VSRLVLNTGPVLAGNGVAYAHGPDAGEALARSVLRAVNAHTNDAGRLDYRALRRSSEFAEALGHARRLINVDIDDGHPREARLAFWINIYNALALHGAVALNVRRSVWHV
jgi:Protein of unknown function, DUF547